MGDKLLGPGESSDQRRTFGRKEHRRRSVRCAYACAHVSAHHSRRFLGLWLAARSHTSLPSLLLLPTGARCTRGLHDEQKEEKDEEKGRVGFQLGRGDSSVHSVAVCRAATDDVASAVLGSATPGVELSLLTECFLSSYFLMLPENLRASCR